eukprot:2775899-Rhodomonas_salina.3
MTKVLSVFETNPRRQLLAARGRKTAVVSWPQASGDCAIGCWCIDKCRDQRLPGQQRVVHQQQHGKHHERGGNTHETYRVLWNGSRHVSTGGRWYDQADEGACFAQSVQGQGMAPRMASHDPSACKFNAYAVFRTEMSHGCSVYTLKTSTRSSIHSSTPRMSSR